MNILKSEISEGWLKINELQKCEKNSISLLMIIILLNQKRKKKLNYRMRRVRIEIIAKETEY